MNFKYCKFSASPVVLCYGCTAGADNDGKGLWWNRGRSGERRHSFFQGRSVCGAPGW